MHGKPFSSSSLAKNYLIHNVSSAEVEKTCPMLINESTFLKAQQLINPPADLVPGSGKSLEEGNGNSLQYFCLENLMARGAWQATVLGSHIVRED